MKKELFTTLQLDLFAVEGGTEAAAGEATPAAGEEQNAPREIEYGLPSPTEKAGGQNDGQSDTDAQQTADQSVDLGVEFDELINGKYKDEFEKRVKPRIEAAVKNRFKPNREQAEKAKLAEKLIPLLDPLAMKYGLPADAKPEQIVQAVQADKQLLEEAAAERGLTADQYRYLMNTERENARLRAAEQERQRQQQIESQISRWSREAEDTKALYPDFDLRKEIDPEQSPDTAERFLRLLQSNVDVKAAYQIVHMDDLIGGAMVKTAKVVQKKMSDDIRARGMRPQENGANSNAPSILRKMDPSEFTDEDLINVHNQVMEGKEIRF